MDGRLEMFRTFGKCGEKTLGYQRFFFFRHEKNIKRKADQQKNMNQH